MAISSLERAGGPRRIALVAHDAKKDDLIAWARRHRDALAQARLCGTGTTGDRIGSISGGCLEEDVLARAQQVLAGGVAESVVNYTTSEND